MSMGDRGSSWGGIEGGVDGVVSRLPGLVYRRRADAEWTLDLAAGGTEELTGYAPEQLAGDRPASFLRLVHPDDREAVRREVETAAAQHGRYAVTCRLCRSDGELRWVLDHGRVFLAPDGRVVAHEGFVTDVTERRALEQETALSQKMESMARLAGVVAHDFNNMLVVILSYAGLVLRELPESSAVRDFVVQMEAAARRAAGLTRQLLLFSRRESPEQQVVDPGASIRDLERALRRAAGDQIALRLELAPRTWSVRIGPVQLEQMLSNFATNARDAAPGGGELRIETADETVDAAAARRHPGLAPGDYVHVTAVDTGAGMTEEVAARAFEPFFSTRGHGQGAGLGLALTYAAVKQAGGAIRVESRVGEGTTFHVYLPAVKAEGAADRPDGAGPARAAADAETVLVVEDEDIVRGLVKRLLVRHGYDVLEARSGSEALALAAHRGRIDLLLTDLIMPQMSGRELSARLAESRPAMRVLFMSGYTHEIVSEHGVEPGVAFIEKPFDEGELLRKVRALLD